MNNRGLSIFSVLFYTVAMAASVIVVFAYCYSYGSFAQRYSVLSAKQPVTPPVTATAHNKSNGGNAMQLRNVKFSVKSPKAKEVDLVADFNLWGQHKVVLENNGSGTFSKTVILPQGEYKYCYKVDGQEVKDSAALQSAFHEGKEVSVRVVL